MKLNLLDRILLHFLKKYTQKIYRLGLIDGFNFNEKSH